MNSNPLDDDVAVLDELEIAARNLIAPRQAALAVGRRWGARGAFAPAAMPLIHSLRCDVDEVIRTAAGLRAAIETER